MSYSIGQADGTFRPGVGTNFAVDQQGNANAQVGGGVNFGSFNIGGLNDGFNPQNNPRRPVPFQPFQLFGRR